MSDAKQRYLQRVSDDITAELDALRASVRSAEQRKKRQKKTTAKKEKKHG